ncbi:Cell shape-determining protein MreC [Candidatus Magnetaquicoccaceae bacterium FCR-1]|uniref:Cell shape-determining protein MreC n=1 Tax=Candidatus Magnetaquiglobus chichijimensis TaxID=3141448 RepID=A0ABQ0C9H1_9PROT
MTALLGIFREFRHAISVFLTLVVALFLLLMARGTVGDRHGMHESVLQLAGTAQSFLTRPVSTIEGFQARLSELARLDRENRQYKAELERLRPLGVRLDELEKENHRLKSLLQMRPDPDFQPLAVRVVGDSSSAFARSFIVNAGRQDGVIVNAPVTVPSGLVGRVVRASANASLVLSMLDLNSRVPILIQRSRVKAVCAGQNDTQMTLEYLPKDADVVVGDVVVTSGTGGIFPKGLVVGKVVSLEPGDEGLFREAMVQPTVDFGRIEEAHLLLPRAVKPTADNKPLP